jgi:hypothetical protein
VQVVSLNTCAESACGFRAGNYNVMNRFQTFASNFDLRRYNVDMSRRRCGWAPRSVEMGAGAPLPVGPHDVLQRGCGRAPGRAAVGAGARLPVG